MMFLMKICGVRMAYETLEKLFYKNAGSDRFSQNDALACERLHGDSAFATGIQLEHGELFMITPPELSLASEYIFQTEEQIQGLWQTLPRGAQRAYLWNLIVGEVVFSNEIEGVHSTRRQIEQALESAEKTARTTSAEDAAHTPFFEFARLYLELTADPKQPETLEDIRAIYDSVVAGTVAEGDLPRSALFRNGSISVVNGHKTVHEGVAAKEVPGMLQQWLALAQNDELPLLYRAAICHFLFEYIHPFFDGNGRTGRYLLSLQLSRVASIPTVLSLSRVIAANKSQYYKAFDIAEKKLNHAEATYFVIVLLDLVKQAQTELVEELAQKSFALEQAFEHAASFANAHPEREAKALRILAQAHLFASFGEVRASEVAQQLEASAPTTRAALTSLEAQGLIAKTSKRPAAYTLTPEGLQLLGIE